MKKVSLLCILTFLPLILLAQENNEWFLDSSYHYNWYNEDNGWELTSRQIFAYDHNGNQTEDIRSIWIRDGNYWNHSSGELNSYDDQGKLIEHIWYYYTYEANEWQGGNRSLFVYDTNGNPTSKLYFSGMWMPKFGYSGLLFIEYIMKKGM